MQKKFNITGLCIPEKHYMVDTSNKISAIAAMIEQGDYFVINRPRQYGKTTTIYMLDRLLKTSAEYFPFPISFEGMGHASFAGEEFFIKECILLLKEVCENTPHKEWVSFFESSVTPLSFNQLGRWIERLVEKIGKKIVLMIDEVDKSSNNQLFLDFLGMLRSKYLKRNQGVGLTFHSVILAGVHDVKTLKSQIRPDEEKKFNSPWNIAADFEVDISFSSLEIQSMLDDYVSQRRVCMDIPLMAGKLFYFTSGYPFLVSLLCKILDEKIMPAKGNNEWQEVDLEKAVQIALKKDNTNFESLIKNLENNPDLYEFIFKLIMNGTEFLFNRHTPVIHFGTMYGILKEEQGKVRVHNRIYEQIIYDYMASKLETSGDAAFDHFPANYLDDGRPWIRWIRKVKKSWLPGFDRRA
jgi:hypothetical protein